MRENKAFCAVFLIYAILFEGIGAYIGILTSPSSQMWYQDLTKPPLTPPGIAFAIVWPLLYLCLAWCAAHISMIRPFPFFLAGLFGGHMFMNWLWSFIFFTFHLTGVSLFLLSIILLTALGVVYYMKKESLSSWPLLLPYIGWLCFAFYLNGYIFMNN